MVKSDSAVVVSRLKREDCERITHDRDFSKWKILVGPSDWEDYSLGKDGAARYRVQNLPGSSSPGVYELAIAVSHTGLGRKIEKLDPEHIVVVYLGQAENVRTRLQHYGRTGAHLANSYSTSHPTDCKTDSLQNRPGLFEEILSRGYPIVFRWAPGLSNVYTKKQANLYAHYNISGATFYIGDHESNNSINNSNFIGTMQNKSDAHKTETKLLNKFDYAWNTSINGSRRPDDILQKLRKVSSSSNRFPVVQRLLPVSQKKVGTRIKASKLLSTENNFNTCADEESPDIPSRVFKFGRSQPRLVVDRGGITEENTVICGVTIAEDSVCRRPPVKGRKRCAEHKGMKINGNLGLQHGVVDKRESDSHRAPSFKHEGASLPLVTVKYPVCEGFSHICGFILSDGSPCIMQPLKGNRRCEEHKGRRINKLLSTENNFNTRADAVRPYIPSRVFEFGRSLPRLVVDRGGITEENSVICGVTIAGDSVCRRPPVKGRRRCAEHKGMKINGNLGLQHGVIDKRESDSHCARSFRHEGAWLPPVTVKYPVCEGFSHICGFILSDGSPCIMQPLKGNKRCAEHKGRRIRKSEFHVSDW